VTQVPVQEPERQPSTSAGPLPELLPGQTSLFVNGAFPKRRAPIVLLAAIGGILLSYLWSAELVDKTIGFNAASTMLGHDAVTTPIGGIASGVIFALVSGLAGSFTACNIAAFGAAGPLIGSARTRRERFTRTVKPLGWMAVGIIPVSAIYGMIVGLVGTTMPQFSTAKTTGLSPRSIQSMVTFGLIGLVLIVLGLAALGVIRDPLAPVSRRFRNAPMILMGVLIGGFLIGRPYPLFREMFRHAAETHNPLYGATAFVLQSFGNIIVLALLFVIITYGTGGRLQRWLGANPTRTTILTATTFIVAGAFTVIYWNVRILGRLGYIWFPTAPWNN
jgi:hypothetical protein